MKGRARIRFVEDLGGLELIEAVHPRPYFSRHAHPTYAIGLVSWGANRFRYRGSFHIAVAGALCTVTPDEAHAVEPAGGGFAYRCLYPSTDALRAVAESVAGRRPSGTLILPPVVEDAATAALVAGVFAAEDAGASRLDREARLLALLTRVVVRHATAAVVPRLLPPPPAALRRARDYLAEHCAENVSLARLAAIAELDPFQLVRGFSRVFGLPPHSWLVQERVRRAQTLLRGGLAPADVAARVGFSDQSHLNRHFKRIVGISPGRYRMMTVAVD